MFKRITKTVAAAVVAGIIATGMMTDGLNAAEAETATVAFPDKYMIRVGGYFVNSSDTQFSINGNILGTTIDFQRDLGGDSRATLPRLDAYYRFNPRHRIDFTAFSIDRKGSRTLALDGTIGDADYSINETLNSDIKYTLYKLGYAYSFYHSPKVELSVTAGLNFTSYDFQFSDTTGGKAEAAGFSAPLPMFGLSMGYAITPKWSVHYKAETFFIDFEGKVKGALVNYEVNTEYKLFKNFAIGAGLVRS